MRSWTIAHTQPRSGAPLTAEQIAASAATAIELPADPRLWLAARIAACRACEHAARGGQTCAACDLRCTHPLAAARPPLLADQTSTCPAGLWPVTQ